MADANLRFALPRCVKRSGMGIKMKKINKQKIKNKPSSGIISAKRLAAVLAAAASAFIMAACSEPKQQAAADEPEQTYASETAASEEPSSPAAQEETTLAPYGVTTLSLYVYNQAAGIRERSEGYSSEWVRGKDIVSFEAFATDEASFSFGGRYFDSVWNSYWERFDNAEECKIGYTIAFPLKSGEIVKKTILHPDDVFSYRNYLECYLYDDVHQVQGNWYSHLLASEVTDDTVMTSIKLTAGADIDQVGSTITLTAFVYSPKYGFDEAGNYTGPVQYTVTVKNTAG